MIVFPPGNKPRPKNSGYDILRSDGATFDFVSGKFNVDGVAADLAAIAKTKIRPLIPVPTPLHPNWLIAECPPLPVDGFSYSATIFDMDTNVAADGPYPVDLSNTPGMSSPGLYPLVSAIGR